MAKRTQYYCPFLTPSALPPLLSREFPRTPAGGNGCSVGAAYMPPATDRGFSSTGSHPPTSGTLPACFAATSPDGEAPLAGFAHAKKGPLVKGGWPRQRPGGFRRAVRHHPFPVNLRPLRGAGLPPSLAPLVHNFFTPPRRGRACPALHLAITTPFILCIVGRGCGVANRGHG